MIARYTRPELGAVWTDEARMTAWRDVEVAAAEALEDGPTAADLEAIRAATFTVEAVAEREAVTDHDVAAFIDVLSASAGPGRALDPLRADVLRRARHRARAAAAAGGRADPRAARASSPTALAERAREFADTLCVGRTHGVHAEPTTFGLKLAGYAFEAHRNAERLERAFDQAAVGAISGAVGTYAAHDPAYEARVLERLGLRAEDVSTQVVPRDRHAELLQAIALAGAGLERFATEIRHLQRTEVREVEEPFRAGQKGSSAMPHKRNPITTERITGLARVLRGYAQAAIENVALWHERDISHSGAERVILPDATILIHYMQHLALRVVRGMTVHPDRMARNLDLTCGALFSQTVLLALVERGMARDDAYRIVQGPAQRAWDTQTPLRELLAAEPAAAGLDLDALFDYGRFTRHVPEVLGAPRRDPPAGMSEPILLRAAPGASADLFHAVPLDIIDPFLYVEVDDRRFCGQQRARARPHQGARRSASRCSTRSSSGWTSCSTPASASSRPRSSATCARCRQIGHGARDRAARLPARVGRPAARGGRRAARRRRGVRPAPARQDGGAARRHPPRPGRRRRRDGAPRRGCCASCPAGLTCEQVREEMQRVCGEHDAELPETAIVAHGAQSAVGHEEGSGPIERGEVVLIDIWPRDKASRCWADMTRTFVAGGEAPPAELQEYWELTLRVARRRQGRDPRPAPSAASCTGSPASRSRRRASRRCARRSRARCWPRATTTASGTGSGLEVHERPNLGRSRREADRGRRHDGRAGVLPPGLRGRAGWRTCCSSPRTAAKSSRTFRTTSRRRAETGRGRC